MKGKQTQKGNLDPIIHTGLVSKHGKLQAGTKDPVVILPKGQLAKLIIHDEHVNKW